MTNKNHSTKLEDRVDSNREGNARYLPYVRETLGYLMPNIEVRLTPGKLPNTEYLTIGDITIDVPELDVFKLLYLMYARKPVEQEMAGFTVIGQKKAVIREGQLARVIDSIGHELGHLLTPKLPLPEEEAKALAFEYAWCKTIEAHNIGNLGDKPLRGLLLSRPTKKYPDHFRARKFVMSLLKSGYDPMKLYRDIINPFVLCGN